MKNQCAGALPVVLLAAGSMLFSCGGGQKTEVLTFDTLKVSKTEHLFADTARPACDVQVSFAYITHANNAATADSLNSVFLLTALGDEYADMQPAEAVDAYVKKYLSDYHRDMEPIYKEDQATQEKEDETSTFANWYDFYRTVNTRPQYDNGHVLVYRVDYSEFTGGAHGNYMSTFLNMDLQQLTPIRLSDLFEGDYHAALTELLWSQLLADNNLKTRQEAENMGYATTGNLEPTENFYLSDNGITFFYNTYEITPYVMGTVSITLSYEALQPLLHSGIMATYGL
ncbi:MAG: DUF3298 and DUF4163 domain-containing protein [Prevotellaceae bacterium]|jgi:hypothetical protein|nr:DUF3298 and DUF4163 domain-containing protein [Prevotellaceae bacterium]